MATIFARMVRAIVKSLPTEILRSGNYRALSLLGHTSLEPGSLAWVPQHGEFGISGWLALSTAFEAAHVWHVYLNADGDFCVHAGPSREVLIRHGLWQATAPYDYRFKTVAAAKRFTEDIERQLCAVLNNRSRYSEEDRAAVLFLDNDWSIHSGSVDADDPDAPPVGDYISLVDPAGKQRVYFEIADLVGDLQKLRSALATLFAVATEAATSSRSTAIREIEVNHAGDTLVP